LIDQWVYLRNWFEKIVFIGLFWSFARLCFDLTLFLLGALLEKGLESFVMNIGSWCCWVKLGWHVGLLDWSVCVGLDCLDRVCFASLCEKLYLFCVSVLFCLFC
jgi:hypothetical protein